MHSQTNYLALCCVGAAMIVSGCCAQCPWRAPDQSPANTASGLDGGLGGSLGGLGANPAEAGKAKNTLALARLCEHHNQLEQAERLYHQVLERNPNNEVAIHRLAVLASRQGKLKEAEELFRRALVLKPNNAELLGDIGYFYYVAGRMKDAERYLRRGLEIEPNSRMLTNNLAQVVGALGRDAESLALFQRAETGPQADANLGFVLAQRGEYQKSLDAYNRALTDDNSMRTAAEALIELSKRLPDRRMTAPAAAPDPLAVANSPIPPAPVAPVAPSRPTTEVAAPLQNEPPSSQFNHSGGSQREIANAAIPPQYRSNPMTASEPVGAAPGGSLAAAHQALPESGFQRGTMQPQNTMQPQYAMQPQNTMPSQYTPPQYMTPPQYNPIPTRPTQIASNPAGATPPGYDSSVQQAPPVAWSQPAATMPPTGTRSMPAPPPNDGTNSAAYEEPATNPANAAVYGPEGMEAPAEPGHLARFPSVTR